MRFRTHLLRDRDPLHAMRGFAPASVGTPVQGMAAVPAEPLYEERQAMGYPRYQPHPDAYAQPSQAFEAPAFVVSSFHEHLGPPAEHHAFNAMTETYQPNPSAVDSAMAQFFAEQDALLGGLETAVAEQGAIEQTTAEPPVQEIAEAAGPGADFGFAAMPHAADLEQRLQQETLPPAGF